MIINLSLNHRYFLLKIKPSSPPGNNEDGSRTKFPALFFPPVFSTVGGEGEERQCLCSEKADLYCGKSKNAQIYFFLPQVCLARSF